MRSFLSTFLMGATLSAMAATTATAQGVGPISFSGSAALVSDYRFRGVSRSDRDLAVQAGLHAGTTPGFFLGAWGSTVKNYADADVEVDVYGGWTGRWGLFTPTVGIYSYLYPGGSDADMFELYGSLAANYGPATITIGVNWAPDQGNLDRSSRYAYALARAGIPLTPLTAKASIGHEKGALVADLSGRTTEKLDYMIGVEAHHRNLILGASFVGNDLPEKSLFNTSAKNRFMVSLTAVF